MARKSDIQLKYQMLNVGMNVDMDYNDAPSNLFYEISNLIEKSDGVLATRAGLKSITTRINNEIIYAWDYGTFTLPTDNGHINIIVILMATYGVVDGDLVWKFYGLGYNPLDGNFYSTNLSTPSNTPLLLTGQSGGYTDFNTGVIFLGFRTYGFINTNDAVSGGAVRFGIPKIQYDTDDEGNPYFVIYSGPYNNARPLRFTFINHGEPFNIFNHTEPEICFYFGIESPTGYEIKYFLTDLIVDKITDHTTESRAKDRIPRGNYEFGLFAEFLDGDTVLVQKSLISAEQNTLGNAEIRIGFNIYYDEPSRKYRNKEVIAFMLGVKANLIKSEREQYADITDWCYLKGSRTRIDNTYYTNGRTYISNVSDFTPDCTIWRGKVRAYRQDELILLPLVFEEMNGLNRFCPNTFSPLLSLGKLQILLKRDNLFYIAEISRGVVKETASSHSFPVIRVDNITGSGNTIPADDREYDAKITCTWMHNPITTLFYYRFAFYDIVNQVDYSRKFPDESRYNIRPRYNLRTRAGAQVVVGDVYNETVEGAPITNDEMMGSKQPATIYYTSPNPITGKIGKRYFYGRFDASESIKAMKGYNINSVNTPAEVLSVVTVLTVSSVTQLAVKDYRFFLHKSFYGHNCAGEYAYDYYGGVFYFASDEQRIDPTHQHIVRVYALVNDNEPVLISKAISEHITRTITYNPLCFKYTQLKFIKMYGEPFLVLSVPKTISSSIPNSKTYKDIDIGVDPSSNRVAEHYLLNLRVNQATSMTGGWSYCYCLPNGSTNILFDIKKWVDGSMMAVNGGGLSNYVEKLTEDDEIYNIEECLLTNKLPLNGNFRKKLLTSIEIDGKGDHVEMRLYDGSVINNEPYYEQYTINLPYKKYTNVFFDKFAMKLRNEENTPIEIRQIVFNLKDLGGIK